MLVDACLNGSMNWPWAMTGWEVQRLPVSPVQLGTNVPPSQAGLRFGSYGPLYQQEVQK